MGMIDQGRQIQDFYTKQCRLRHTNYSLIYQYRNLDSFWHILESDCFWATNARFSNDTAEQIMGIKELKKLLQSPEDNVRQDDCYIICFCKENNKLSQWRGYATNGVSIGFDFHAVLPFYMDEQAELYNSCYDVYYINDDMKVEDLEVKFSLDSAATDNKEKIPQQIPYVKHIGFEEEDECRLVFFNENGSLNPYVHYRDGKLGEKIPYIKVGLKSKKSDKKSCTVRLLLDEGNVDKNKQDELYYRIKSETTALNIHVISCFAPDLSGDKEFDDSKCWGCSQRVVSKLRDNKEWQEKAKECGYQKDIGMSTETSRRFMASMKSNCIMISSGKDQEKVFEVVDHIVTKYNRDIKKEENKISIWCEGHLPIRSITVGPLKNQEEIKESIQHYCQTHYWLKYVKVDVSGIPYRS